MRQRKLGKKKQQDEGVCQNRLTDGCLEDDKGTQHQVGRGRLWFFDSPLKGPTSDAAPHPSRHPSISLTFLSSFLSKWVSTWPLEGPSSHLSLHRETEDGKECTKPVWRWGHGTLRRPVWGWKDGLNREQGGTELRVVPTALWQPKTTDVDKKKVLDVERWSLLQSKRVQWLEWSIRFVFS